jgi:hypothetical protein
VSSSAEQQQDSARGAIFALGPHIRYVAFARGQAVDLAQRAGVIDASDAGSDFFEELFVNPALLTLAKRRGDLDCGGFRFIVVGYGNFNQIVVGTGEYHVSVCVEPDADPIHVGEQVRQIFESA